ncbi:MAG TPA: DUF222 domain-containing protein [Candidatus Dormibacteraeota bacterium]|nr:DUF222 domain-containing protein [Candidatus Dormibacteraeota bacterium]
MAAPGKASELFYEGSGGYVPPSFASVEEGLAVIDRGGPENLTTNTLREDLKWFTIQQRTLEAMSARWLGELDRREQQAPDDDFHSCTRWLSETLKLTPNAAYAHVRTARMLEQLPWTAAAFRRGQISSQHVAVIRRAMEQVPKTCLDPSDVEPALVFAARQMDTFNLEQHWQQIRYQADQEAALEAEEERRRQRWLSLRQISTGNYRIEGVLDAEGGATLKTAIRSLLGPRPASDDERTPAQRRADAIVELARRRLDAGDLPERGGEKPHLLLTADLSTLRLAPGSRLAQLDWGPLVTGETARRLADDASITPVLVDDKGGILHVGRSSRSVPGRLRKALNLRDRHCVSPGCTTPPELCVPHHRLHWADGGRTVLPNLELRCDVHHGRLHPENHRFRQSRAP